MTVGNKQMKKKERIPTYMDVLTNRLLKKTSTRKNPKSGKNLEQTSVDSYLDELFSNFKNDALYTSKTKMLKKVKSLYPNVKKSQFEKWFMKKRVYTLHKPVQKPSSYSQTMTHSLNVQYQADLVDLSKIAKKNKGFRFLVTCIDIFSKFAWAVPIKKKTGDELVRAFEIIFKKNRPLLLQTDKGSEFYNRKFKAFLKSENVRLFSTNSEMKASIVERFNRTLKTRMWKYFTDKNTRTYIDVLPVLVNHYNNTYHTSIKSIPSLVSKENAPLIWLNLYGENTVVKNYKYDKGDLVRISKQRKTFAKGYLPNWTEEIFQIVNVITTHNPVKYEIKDQQNNLIKGTFYENELQKVLQPTLHQIEKVLRKKFVDGKQHYLVRWLGYPPSFDSWISSTDINKNG